MASGTVEYREDSRREEGLVPAPRSSEGGRGMYSLKRPGKFLASSL